MNYHLPLILCVDTSSSMNESSENGKSKIQIVEEMINSFASVEAERYQDQEIDLCVIAFNDKVETLIDWIPLSEFRGEINLKAEGNSVLGSAVITSIDRIRERKSLYRQLGITSKQPIICLFTDGYSSELLDEAYEKSYYYLNQRNAAKMYITFVTPSADEKVMKMFSESIEILNMDDFDQNKLVISWLSKVPNGCSAEESHISIRIPEPLLQDDFELNDDTWDWDDDECTDFSNKYIESIKPKNPMGVHIPIVICIDTSSSMNDTLADGQTKKQIFEELINDIADISLTEYDKQNVEICILVFDDEVRTLVDWRPLCDFNGGIKLNCAGTTALGSAIIRAVEKSRERHREYALTGIQSARSFLFVFTDGYNMYPLKEVHKVSEYFNNRRAKMFITMLPPLKDSSELSTFGEKITIFRTKDCTDSVKSSFDIIQNIIEWHFCGRSSDDILVPIPDNLEVLNRKGKDDVIMENGEKYFKMNNDEFT